MRFFFKKTWVLLFKQIFILFLIVFLFFNAIYIVNYIFPFLQEGLDTNSNKKVFITFGTLEKNEHNKNDNYIEAVDRITRQASELEIFDTIKRYNEDDLKNDNEFWSNHSNFVLSNKKGYGYWIWKPYLIMKTLETMNDHDILLYSDCGCELDIRNKKEMENLFESVKQDLLIASTNRPEKERSKMDVIVYFDMKTPNIMDSLQHQATTICILKCSKTNRFVKEWYETCCKYELIDDSPSKIENDGSFIEHRHDQSIFSLLTKKPEYDFRNMSIEKAVIMAHNRTGKSVL
jgi:hypothetical protein